MKRVQKILHSHPVIHRYLSDDLLKVFVSLVSSLTFNVLYAVWEIICGIYYQSYWFVTLGCYYLLLTLARLLLLREAHGRKEARQAEWKRYRACGILLLFLNLILSGIIVLAVIGHQGSHYAGYLIYAMAAYTTCKIVIAIRSLVKYRDFSRTDFGRLQGHQLCFRHGFHAVAGNRLDSAFWRGLVVLSDYDRADRNRRLPGDIRNGSLYGCGRTEGVAYNSYWEMRKIVKAGNLAWISCFCRVLRGVLYSG